jgi:hypothetical protein
VQIKIGPNWISAALTLASAGVAMKWPDTGTLLMIGAAFVLLAGIRVEGWKFTTNWVDSKRLGQVAIGLVAMGLLLAIAWRSSPVVQIKPAKLSVEQITTRVDGNDVKFDYYVRNVGGLPSIGFMHNESAALPEAEKTDDAETDRAFDALKISMKIPEWEKSNSEIQPGEARYFTFLYKLTKDQYDQVTNGPLYLYLLALLKYRDTSLSDKQWWYTEECNFTMKKQALHDCKNHSGRTYSE